RFDQSVRIRIHDPAGIRPWRRSHWRKNSTVRRKSASVAASREQSITQAGAMKLLAGIVSVLLSGKCRPEIQWIGASKWVPVCSLQEKLFQYQPGPRASYREVSSMRKGQACPISGGNTICGKSGDKVWVRSTT